MVEVACGAHPAALTRPCWKMLLIQLVKVFSCIRTCCACSFRMWPISYAESMARLSCEIRLRALWLAFCFRCPVAQGTAGDHGAGQP